MFFRLRASMDGAARSSGKFLAPWCVRLDRAWGFFLVLAECFELETCY